MVITITEMALRQIEDLTAIANAITSGEFDNSFESLLNSYREIAEKGKEARKLTLVAQPTH